MAVSDLAGAARTKPHSFVTSFLTDLARLLEHVRSDAFDQAVQVLLDARAVGRRVYVIGNGGSAATASHVVCDLVKGAQVPGHRPLRAFSLSDNTPLLTAWANDSTYDRVFAEQLEALVEPDDVVIAISASGKSPNIVAALTTARANGARTIGLLGFDGGTALPLTDVAIHVPSSDYGLVEAAHLAIGQAIAVAIRVTLEQDLASARSPASKNHRQRS
jgi:D-sedoheptulose 7-phosphate isomerase